MLFRSVDQRVLEMCNVEDYAELFSAPAPPTQPPVDPANMLAAQAAMVTAQAKQVEAQAKAADVQAKQQATGLDAMTKVAVAKSKIQDIQTKAMATKTDAINHAADRDSKLRLEKMRLEQTAMVHKDKIAQADRHKAADIQSSADESGAQRMHDAIMAANDQAHQTATSDADRAAQAGFASLPSKAPDNA